MENIIHTRTEAVHMINIPNNAHSLKDCEIVEMYWRRDESAISETQKKYSAYLSRIARNILGNTQDSEERVNDTYLKAWNSMPTHRPENLATFLGKIIRNLSINTVRDGKRQKRLGSQYALSLTELENCVPTGGSPHEAVEERLLTDKINEWVDSCSPETGNVFVGRYYFNDSVKSIAADYNMSESKVKSILFRARKSLKEFLEKEGFTV